jgi:fatty acid desaturase
MTTEEKYLVTNINGIKWLDYRKKLTPKYEIVWFHLIMGYVGILTVFLVLSQIQQFFTNHHTIIICDFIASIIVGYLIAFIHLFLHEAAHYNIAKTKKINDLLANIFIGVIIGTDIQSYRTIHWDHHRYLGTTLDTEKSYFEPLNFIFFLNSLCGLRVIQILKNRKNRVKKTTYYNNIRNKNNTIFTLGLTVNITIMVILFKFFNWHGPVVWIFGMGLFFPFFASIRQVLEHRDEFAESNENYNHKNHGRVNRIFGSSIFASTFGGAGFNKHLLHHWDPMISYTRLDELERFLMDSNLSHQIVTAKTSYVKTFVKIFKNSNQNPRS